MSHPGSLNRLFLSFLLLALVGFLPATVRGSDDSASQAAAKTDQGKATADDATDQSDDPLKRPIDAKQKKQHAKALKKELMSDSDKQWLNQDVTYIITDEERKAFKQLSNEEERE